MNFLALDLGTITGYAVGDSSGIVVATGYRILKRYKTIKDQYYNFDLFLEQLLQKYNIKQIYYEKVYSHKGSYAAHLYGYYEGLLFNKAIKYELPEPVGYGVTEIKKNATLEWKKGKNEIQQALNEKYNKNIKQLDESDALAVLNLAFQRQKEVLKREKIGRKHL